jgi:hypothetical protein
MEKNEGQAVDGEGGVRVDRHVRPIARLPKYLDVKCQGCEQWEPIVLNVGGLANCHYCGNEIPLCEPCAKRMMQELKSLGWA